MWQPLIVWWNSFYRYMYLTLHSTTDGRVLYTAMSEEVAGKSARDNPERYCGRLEVDCSSNKFERMAWEAMDVCLRALKESNKSRFNNTDHIPYYPSGLSLAHFFPTNFLEIAVYRTYPLRRDQQDFQELMYWVIALCNDKTLVRIWGLWSSGKGDRTEILMS